MESGNGVDLLRSAPPQNLEAERYVISSALQDRLAVDLVSAIIGPDDFYRSAHAAVWRVILDLHKSDAPTTVDAVHIMLKQRGQLDAVGGLDELVALESASPGGDAPYYAGLMVDAARLRAARMALAVAQSIITETTAPAGERLARIEDTVSTAVRARGGAESVRGIFSVCQQLAQSLEEKTPPGMGTGIFGVDEFTGGLQPGEVTILGGRPGAGKTSFAMNVVRYQAVTQRRKVLVFSLEMPEVALAASIVCQMARVNGKELRARTLGWESQGRVVAAADRLSETAVDIVHRDCTPTDVRAIARARSARHGLDLLVVDYVQLLVPDFRGGRRQRHEEVAEMSREMKRLAGELRIPVLCLAALNRQSEARAGFKPRLADLRESGALEADAALVLLLHSVKYSETDPAKRDAMPPGDDTEVIVAKNRFGPVGETQIDFERPTGLMGDRGEVHAFARPVAPAEVARGPDP